MKNKKNWILKKLHLLISLSIVVPIAFVYGSPSILPQLLDIQANTIDLSNLLKAVMCLYLGVSIVWILGIWKTKYWKRATELNILFMLSLGIGRAISMVVDGIPTKVYIIGIIGEIALGLFSIYQLNKYGAK